MANFKSSAALAAVTLLATFVALPSIASAQTSCKWYAAMSLKQQKENERLKCGFQGPAWNADLKAHMSWCNTVAPAEWKKSAQERDKQLNQCAKQAS